MSREMIKGFKMKEEIEAIWTTIAQNTITYEIYPTAEQKLGEITLLLTSEQSVEAWTQDVIEIERSENKIVIQVDLTQAIKEVFEPQVIRWKTYLRTEVDGQEYIYRLANSDIKAKMEGHEDLKLYRMDFLYGEPFAEIGDFEVRPYYTVFGRSGIMVYEKERRYISGIMNKATDVSIKKNQLKIEFSYQSIPGYEPCCVSMALRNSKEVENMRYEMPIKIKEKDGKWKKAEANLSLDQIKLRALYWDVYLEYQSSNGERFLTKLKNYSQKFVKKQFMSFWRDDTYSFGNDEIFYPYMTTTDSLAFQCREKGEYDGLSFRLKERIAAGVYRLFKPYWKNKKIHLVYEKFCMMAQDNGYYFFKYCMENNMEEKMDRSIYYVMDKNSPDMSKLAPYKKNVVKFMSIRYIVYLLASKLLISTDTRTHAYAWRRKTVLFLNIWILKNWYFYSMELLRSKK